MDDTTSVDTTATTSTTSSEPSAPPSTGGDREPTTDRPSLKDALDVFNEAAKQQGRKARGNRPTCAAPEQGSAPTEPGAATDAPTTPTPPHRGGAVPTEQHIKAVENARQKARAEAEQEYASKWSGLDPDQARQAVQWMTRAAQNREGFLAEVIQEARSNPNLSHLFTPFAATPQTTAPHGPPQPDFTDGQGNAFYSAKAQEARDQWLVEKVKAEILGQVQPDLETIRQEREAAHQQRVIAENQRAVQTRIQDARKTWPHFETFREEIRNEVAKMPLTSGHPAEEADALWRAYSKVVLPHLAKLEQDRIVADLQKQANANSLNPGSTGAAVGIPKKVRARDGGTMADALAWAASNSRS